MLEALQTFFSTGSFIPHGHCYLWQPGLVSLHIIADAMIAIAYYSIPITLLYFVRKRQDLPFRWVFLLFGAFIVACGTTHLLEIWTLWYPMYWLSGTVKVATAAISLITALELIPLLPKALSLPSPAQLEAANRELEREIVERKHIELALRESEARYRAIVEDQTELIVRFQSDGTLTFVNGAYCRYFGVVKEAVIGSCYKPLTFEEDHENIDRLVRSMNRDNPTVRIENRVVIDQHICWTQWNNRMLFDEEGRFVEFQAVGRDITDLKDIENALQESQRFAQKIADTSPAAIYVFDLMKQDKIYVNREIGEHLGYTLDDIQALQPAFLQSILHPDDFLQWQANFKRWNTANDGEILGTELRMQQRNGEWRYFQCQETLFARTPDGLPQQILGVAVDITATKQLEELRQAKELLQTSLTEKNVLLKEIHHRVKNNLQIVYSLLRLQQRRIKDQRAADILLESQNRIKSIALIHEKLYRSETLAHINLSQYIPTLAASLFSSYNIHTNIIRLKTTIDDVALDIDTVIPCGLIINELVSNALKYAFPDDRPGEIAIALHASSDRAVNLVVRDNGVGMPAEFELANTDSLGLKLVRDLVQQLEGKLVLSRYAGTEFRITFAGSEI
ncbi:MAG: sensor histidine kinase [Stenomitos frigidus ULC029]